jgi:two-component system nitrate/nitrite response regulator NarL
MNTRQDTFTVVIADDHPLVREGLVGLLHSYPDLKIVAACGDGESAMRAIRTLNPDVAVLDMAMPGLSGLEIVAVLGSSVDTKFVVLTASATNRQIVMALAKGVSGILHKDGAFEDIVHCIREVAAGRQWLSSTIARALGQFRQSGQSEIPEERLTSREQEIMRLVSRGLSNKEAARELGVSEGTIKIHLHRIFQKVGVTSRTALAALTISDRGPLSRRTADTRSRR